MAPNPAWYGPWRYGLHKSKRAQKQCKQGPHRGEEECFFRLGYFFMASASHTSHHRAFGLNFMPYQDPQLAPLVR